MGGRVSDLNAASLEGIAITSLSSGNGTWEYSTNAGATWNAVGSVSGSNALLVRDVDRVRFVPDAQNADSASFDFRAWDRTTGSEGTKVDASTTGGTTAFSTASDTATVSVSAVNDAPSLGSSSLAPVLADNTSPPGATVSGLFGGAFADVDSGSGFGGIAVVANSAAAGSEGVWQYSSDGGSNWFAIGSVGDNNSSLVLSAGTWLRFVPVAGFSGVTSLSVRGLDDGYSGAYSSTAGGSQSRANVDASVNGGATSIAANASNLSTTILAAVPPPPPPSEDPEPDEEPETPETSEEPAVDEVEDLTELLPAPDDGGGGGDSTPSVEDATAPMALPPRMTAPRTESARVRKSGAVRADSVAHESREAGVRTALDVLRDIYLGHSQIGADVLTDLIFSGQRRDFIGELDEGQDDLLALSQLERTMVTSSVAVTSGLSVGYVLWLTRGGLLIASLLSSLPAWRLIDPIPILNRLGLDDESDGDDESLNSMVTAGWDELALDAESDGDEAESLDPMANADEDPLASDEESDEDEAESLDSTLNADRDAPV